MAVAGEFRRLYEYLNKCDWSDTGPDVFAPDVRYHILSRNVTYTGAADLMALLRAHWENDDVHVEVHDVVERGPFVVAFYTGIQNLGGQRVTGALCTVFRMENGKAAEIWTLRGNDPVPVDEG